jgi:sodium/pantothenate symporter
VWINLFAFGGLEAAFLWPILLGLYWPKANATGAVCSVAAGVGVFFAITLLKVPLGGIHAIVPTLAAGLVAFLLGVWLGEGQDPATARTFCDD